MPERPDDRRTTLVQVIQSVLAAGFGVQSNKNHGRDFKHGRARDYRVVGLIAPMLFVLTVYGVVRLILRAVGVEQARAAKLSLALKD